MAKSGITRQYYRVSNGHGYTTTSATDAVFSVALQWETIDTDIINSTSTLNWELFVELINLGNFDALSDSDNGQVAYMTASGYTQVQIDGERVASQTLSETSVTDKLTLLSGTKTITHATNGSASVSFYGSLEGISFYKNNGSQLYYYPANASSYSLPRETFVLDTLPKHAVLLSAPEKFTDEDSPTITFAIPSGVTNVKAYIAFSTSTIDIGSYAVSGSSYTFNFTEAEKAKLWSILDQGLNTKQVYFYVTSEFNGTLYHSEPIISTLEVINYTPIINSNINEIYDTNEKSKLLTGDKYKLIRYVSNAYYNIGAEGRKGAEIEGVLIKNGTLTKYSSTGTFEGVTSPIFEYTATDSRGNSIPLTTTDFSARAGYWIPYVKLTCSSSATEMTADGDVIVTLKGKYFNGNFSASKRNRLRMHYDTVKDGEDLGMTDMGYIDFSDSRGSFSYNSTTSEFTYTFTIPNLIYTSVYEITVRVSDEVAVQGTETQLILASTPIFDWGRTDFNFNVPVTIQGWQVDTVVAENDSEAGYYLKSNGIPASGGYTWHYKKWSSGLLECWCSISVSTDVSSGWGGLYTSGRLDETNLIYPITFVEIPVVVTSLAAGYAGGILMTTGSGSTPVNEYSTGTLEIARGSSYNGATYTINYMVRGRWK
jgi:hypothetical protein